MKKTGLNLNKSRDISVYIRIHFRTYQIMNNFDACGLWGIFLLLRYLLAVQCVTESVRWLQSNKIESFAQKIQKNKETEIPFFHDLKKISIFSFCDWNFLWINVIQPLFYSWRLKPLPKLSKTGQNIPTFNEVLRLSGVLFNINTALIIISMRKQTVSPCQRFPKWNNHKRMTINRLNEKHCLFIALLLVKIRIWMN